MGLMTTKKNCPTCQKEVIGKRKFSNHLATHESITCKLCQKKIYKRNMNKLTTNIKSIHASMRKRGTPQHVIQSVKTMTAFNSGRAGFSPSEELTLRKPRRPTPQIELFPNMK